MISRCGKIKLETIQSHKHLRIVVQSYRTSIWALRWPQHSLYTVYRTTQMRDKQFPYVFDLFVLVMSRIMPLSGSALWRRLLVKWHLVEALLWHVLIVLSFLFHISRSPLPFSGSGSGSMPPFIQVRYQTSRCFTASI